MTFHIDLKPVPRRRGNFVKRQKSYSASNWYGSLVDPLFDETFTPELSLDTTGHQTGTLEF